MSKITFIYPGIGVGRFNTQSGEHNWMPHGIGIVATYAQSKGHDVRIIDMRDCGNSMGLINELKMPRPEYIGISISYMDYKPSQKIIEIARKLHPKVKIIVGGLCPTLFPEMFIDNKDIDHIVTNEGESALLDIVEGRITDRIVTGTKPDVDTLPYINRGLFNYKKELNCGFAPAQSLPHITMISGRGCAFHCSYCQPAESQVYGKGARMRKVDHIIGELKQLYEEHDFKSITWWDDTFTASPKWVYEFCDRYEEKFNASMVACSRADIICNNEKMIERLAEVGLKWLVIGFESGSQRILDNLKKGTTVEQNIRAAEICRKYGVKIFGSFMMGLPTETNEEARTTYELIKKISPEHKMLFYFTPIPGTNIFKYCKDNDLILRDNKLNIERTCNWSPKIKNVDYSYLDKLRLELKM